MSFKIIALADQSFHLVNEDAGDPDIFINPIPNGMLRVTCKRKVIGVQAPTHLRATLLQQALEALTGKISVEDWLTAQAKLYTAARQCMSN